MTKYYFSLRYGETIPAGSSVSRVISNVLREIFPDKPFKIHQISILLRSNTNTGDLVIVYIARNVGDFPSASTTPEAKAGLIKAFGFNKTEADGTWQNLSEVVNYKPPLEFDKDDSLNIIISAGNTGASDREVYFDLNLVVEA